MSASTGRTETWTGQTVACAASVGSSRSGDSSRHRSAAICLRMHPDALTSRATQCPIEYSLKESNRLSRTSVPRRLVLQMARTRIRGAAPHMQPERTLEPPVATRPDRQPAALNRHVALLEELACRPDAADREPSLEAACRHAVGRKAGSSPLSSLQLG